MSTLRSDTEIKPSSDKFSSIYAEAAYTVDMCGFSDDQFGSVDEQGHFSLVTVTSTTILNVVEDDEGIQLWNQYNLACGLDEFGPDMELYVILSQNSQGFVTSEFVTDLRYEIDENWTALADKFDSVEED